jgi:hypothetical protein
MKGFTLDKFTIGLIAGIVALALEPWVLKVVGVGRAA